MLAHYPTRNLKRERARDRYELDPHAYLATEEAAAGVSVLVVGV